MPNRYSFEDDRRSNRNTDDRFHQLAQRRRTNNRMAEEYEMLLRQNRNVDGDSGSFDLASWIQQGSFCGSSCYTRSQVNHELKNRSTSFSSSTISTEDNSSLTDSFDDSDEVKFDASSWLQNQGKFYLRSYNDSITFLLLWSSRECLTCSNTRFRHIFKQILWSAHHE